MGMRQQTRDIGRMCSPRTVKITTIVIGMCMICYIAGPPLCWHLLAILADINRSSCPPCSCDCSSFPILSLPKGLNSSLTDCMRPHDNEPGEETRRNFAGILTEKLRKKEAEALENQRRAEMAFLEARKMTSQYQKDADKCTSGMETCEEAKERAEVALELQRKVRTMWEMRARQKGWRDSS